MFCCAISRIFSLIGTLPVKTSNVCEHNHFCILSAHNNLKVAWGMMLVGPLNKWPATQ